MDDPQIIALFFARKEQALKEMEKRYGSRLFLLAKRILSSTEDAEESVNDTYLAAWNTIPPKRPDHLYGYLAALCRNLSFDRVDWRMAKKRNGELVSLTQEMEMCIPDPSQEWVVEGRALKKALEAFLDSLPKEQRLVFLRRYLYLESIGEIAQRYHFTQSKVKTQLHRTREKLKIYLAKEGIAV